MPFGALAQAFLTVFPAELADKSMVASIVLVARYRRPALVWAGATSAFVVHVVVAVAAGRLVSQLPATPVQVMVAVLFAAGAVTLLRSAGATAVDPAEGVAASRPAGAAAAFGGSFALILAAEWGDLTQLATASLVAAGGHPVGVGLGALLGLTGVAALAVSVGRQLVARVPLRVVNLVAAAVFAAFAVATLVRLFG